MFLKPVRKIRPSSRSITGKRSSQKTQKSHPFESTLERDYLTLLEFDDSVGNYGVQPVTIHYSNNNKPTRYTPDVAVYFKAELNRMPLLVEIKYEAELLEKKSLLEPKFTVARQYACDNGFEFRVVTEKEIRTDYLYNIKFLSRYRDFLVDASLAQIITSQFNQHDQLTPKQLMTNGDTQMSAVLLHTLWQLLANKTIICDMQKKISMTSIIWKNQN